MDAGEQIGLWLIGLWSIVLVWLILHGAKEGEDGKND